MVGLKETNHNNLPLDLTRPVETIVFLALAERMAVDICCEIAHRGCDALVEGGAEG